MSIVQLDIEQLTALQRAQAGQVRRYGEVFDPTFFGPFAVYDALSTLPDGAVQVIYHGLLDMGLVEVTDGVVSVTEDGSASYGTGRVQV